MFPTPLYSLTARDMASIKIEAVSGAQTLTIIAGQTTAQSSVYQVPDDKLLLLHNVVQRITANAATVNNICYADICADFGLAAPQCLLSQPSEANGTFIIGPPSSTRYFLLQPAQPFQHCLLPSRTKLFSELQISAVDATTVWTGKFWWRGILIPRGTVAI